MGYLKIYCHNCKGHFEMYAGDIESKEKVRCPHCLAIMNSRQREKLVNAFFTIEEVNKGLRTRHTEYGDVLMQVEYKTHYVPNEKYCISE